MKVDKQVNPFLGEVNATIKCNHVKGLVVNNMKLGTDVTSLTVANQANI